MDISSARQTIFDALTPVAEDQLAGRVYPYPPVLGRVTPPAIWIEQPEVTRDVVGQNSSVVIASFDVWIMVDGADDAQVALLDDAVSQVWAAMSNVQVPGAVKTRAVSATADSIDFPDRDDHRRRRRAAVVTVDTVVLAATFCPPTTSPVQVPPALVSATTEE